MTFGVVIDWVYSSYHRSILSGILNFAEANDVNILSFVTGRLNPPDQWEANKNVLFDLVSKKNVDGLIILTGTIQNIVGDKEFLKFIKRYGTIPIVSIADKLGNNTSILIDNTRGLKDLFDHLFEKHNYKKIAFVTGPKENPESNSRLKTYIQFLKSKNIPERPELIVEGSFTGISGRNAVTILLDERHTEFDAIVAANDDMALGVIEELASRGIQVPGDMFVAGFDDIENSRKASLTTVRQPIYEQGKAAAQALFNILHKKNQNAVISLSTELIIRESCGCRPSNIMEATICMEKKSKKPFTEYFTMHQDEIVKDITDSLSGNHFSSSKFQVREWSQKIVSALLNSYTSRNPEIFLSTWNKMIFWAIADGFNLTLLHKMVSRLRKNAICCQNTGNSGVFLEDVFHQVRIMIEEANHKILARQDIGSEIQLAKLNAVSGKLADANSLDDLLNIICKVLKDLGIKSCFLSLYENPQKPLGYARLILAYDENRSVELNKKEIYFSSQDLIPKELYPYARRHSMVIQALYQRNEQLGFILMDLQDAIQNVVTYDEICLKISSTLRLIILIEKITHQSRHLEEQVVERTQDLTSANIQLKNEIKERRTAEKKLKQALDKLGKYNIILQDLSLKDDLTNLYNRRGFLTLGEQQLKYARRADKNFAIFFIDMDRLKHINDNYGRQEGDSAIKKVAKLLISSFRAADVIARIGGDEFTVLVFDTNKNDMDTLIKRIHVAFENYNAVSKKSYHLSISIGVNFVDMNNKSTFEEMISYADKKLYEEKQRKKKLIK